MVVLEIFRIAFRALWANKMRSILTTLGIIIGVAAVIGVVSIVQGLQHQITQQLQGVGATYVMVLPDQSRSQGPGLVVRQVKLTWEDGQAIQEQVTGIELITPVVGGTNMQVKYRDRQHQTLVLGVNEDWPEVSNHAVENGRFFSSLDLEHRRRVAVVGLRVVEELWLGDQPIGKEIYVGTLPATLVNLAGIEMVRSGD